MTVSSRMRALLALALCVAVLSPAHAFAAGTGDDPRPTKDVLSPAEAKAKAEDDARYEAWLQGDAARTPEAKTGSRLRPMIIEGACTYLWTPSHKQERSYWCGPATCQIVTDYFGPLYSQSTFAKYLGTTSSGTDFSRVDDCLRFYTARSYWYYSTVDTWNEFCGACEYGLDGKSQPVVADVKIDGSVWPNYRYNHAGHILPIEAFDWRPSTYIVRVNDPYDETSIGGGSTYGHVTYPAWVVYNGVLNHFRQAMIR